MEELELRDYLRILRKRAWLVVLAVGGCVAIAAAFTFTATPMYQARATLFVGERQVTTADLQQGVQVSQLSQQLLETYAEIIRTTPIAERAVRAARLPITPRDLADDVEAQPVIDTQLLRLSYTNSDPEQAKRTVNAIAQAFVQEVEQIEGTPATDGSEPAINVTVVQPALIPAAPVSPRPARNLALAVVLGAMLGLGAAFLVEYFDTTIKHQEDIEDRLGLPVLAGVPRIKARADEIYLEGDNQSAFAETFRKLRTAIQLYGGDAPIQTVLVSSPYSGDGKTTTALNLAAVYAYAGHRTVLVEADMRRPSLHRVFHPNELNGLATMLSGRTSLGDALVDTDIPHLTVLPAAAIPPNPVEILASARMHSLLQDLRRQFDTVVIDAPPLLPVADASTIAARVDGVILVARAKDTRRDRLTEAARLVEKSRGRTLGVVLNAVPVEESGGYTYYQSEYREKKSPWRRRSRTLSR